MCKLQPAASQYPHCLLSWIMDMMFSETLVYLMMKTDNTSGGEPNGLRAGAGRLKHETLIGDCHLLHWHPHVRRREVHAQIQIRHAAWQDCLDPFYLLTLLALERVQHKLVLSRQGVQLVTTATRTMLSSKSPSSQARLGITLDWRKFRPVSSWVGTNWIEFQCTTSGFPCFGLI